MPGGDSLSGDRASILVAGEPESLVRDSSCPRNFPQGGYGVPVSLFQSEVRVLSIRS